MLRASDLGSPLILDYGYATQGSQCLECLEDIRPGEVIFTSPNGTVVHRLCGHRIRGRVHRQFERRQNQGAVAVKD